jgi:probable rRNA maturation factor
MDDRGIRKLNKEFLGKDVPTDVIAFDLSGPRQAGIIRADIAVSTDTAIANAGIFKTGALEELYLYVIHGLLHILGCRDDTTRRRSAMQKRAESILEGICPSIKPKP